MSQPDSDAMRRALDGAQVDPVAGDPAALQELAEVEAELNTRWPETKIDPSLDRIAALTDLLGDPQRSYPSFHVTGTNGKTSTTRVLDSLLTRIGLRTGRTTSPHLQLATERISIDNAPIDPCKYVEVYRDIEPYVSMVDSRQPIPMSKFEVLTGMAYAAFADAPVEAAIVEVGLGGTWDATNVIDAQVAVLCPIDIDHIEYLGNDITKAAAEKAGVIKPGAVAIVAQQTDEVMRVIMERCAEVDATIAREGSEFAVLRREVAVGGQLLTLQGLGGVYEDVFLPLHGAHQAGNAVRALAAAEAFFGAGADRKLDDTAVREAFAAVVNPGRLERVRSTPTVLLDAAHNPHGARALATTIREEFAFRRLIGVVGVMGDKDATGILTELEPVLGEIVLTRNNSPRAMDPDELGAVAREIFGQDRIVIEPRLVDAIDTAVQLADEADDPDQPVGGGGVLITGSVVTAGNARGLFGKAPA